MNGQEWTPKEDRRIIELYPNCNTKELAKELGRSYKTVLNRAYFLGVKKSKAFLQKQGEKLKASGKAHRFKKGHTPMTKGKKQTEYMTPEAIARTAKTRFKKGHKSHNALRDWQETERKDSKGRPYIFIKVPGIRKAVLKHHWLWEKHTGKKVPKGYNVVFKDGNTLNVTIENLECISNAGLMSRNTLHNYPKEIKEIIQLKGAVQRQINKTKKQK